MGKQTPTEDTTDSKGAGLVLDVLEALCGFAATGATNGELVATVKTTPPQITRAMAKLIEKGWARKNAENGRFYPTPAFTRLSFAVLADIQRAETRLADVKQALTAH
jgi:DNA-binding IclR family transcriptional regulator